VDRNFILAIVLSFLVVLTYQNWRAHHAPQLPSRTEAPTQSATEAPQAPGAQMPPAPAPQATPAPSGGAAGAFDTNAPEQRITIENELYRAELTTRGGGIASWQLKKYRTSKDADAPPIDLVAGSPPEPPGLATPLPELGLGDLGFAPFRVVESGPDHASFELSLNGVTVRKRFDFAADSYSLRLRIEVANGSAAPVQSGFAATWPATLRPGSDFMRESMIVLHEGSATRAPVRGLGKPGITGRLAGKTGTETPVYRGDVDWVGVDSTYFLVAIVDPLPRDAIASFEPRGDTGAVASIGYPSSPIPPGLADSREFRVFAGPKERPLLEAFGSGTEASVQLGYRWVAPLTRAFLWLLHALYAVIPNYGVGIVLLTILVRLAMQPLNVRQMRSMKRMSELQPKVQEIQKKYADDRQKQSEETMKLYREAGVNPLGGCFPILLQFPVLMGLYYALQSSIDLRQAPFLGWIRDLSAPEALFTLPGLDLPVRFLPIVMGLSMVVQQKLTPSTMDPAQARMMMTVMPVMFTVMFYQLPSGLVLYWFVSNLLAIGSQIWMQRGKKDAPARS